MFGSSSRLSLCIMPQVKYSVVQRWCDRVHMGTFSSERVFQTSCPLAFPHLMKVSLLNRSRKISFQIPPLCQQISFPLRNAGNATSGRIDSVSVRCHWMYLSLFQWLATKKYGAIHWRLQRWNYQSHSICPGIEK